MVHDNYRIPGTSKGKLKDSDGLAEWEALRNKIKFTYNLYSDHRKK
jgi:hypothetical protein